MAETAPPISHKEQQRQNTLRLVDDILHPPTIQIKNEGNVASLQAADNGEELTPQDVKNKTTLTSDDGTSTESLPDFFRDTRTLTIIADRTLGTAGIDNLGLHDVFFEKVGDKDELKPVVKVSPEQKLILYKALLEKIGSDNFRSALRDVATMRGFASVESVGPEWMAASLQAAALEDATELIGDTKTDNGEIKKLRRNRIYTIMRPTKDGLILEGDDMSTVSRILHLGDAATPLDFDTSEILTVLNLGITDSTQYGDMAVKLLQRIQTVFPDAVEVPDLVAKYSEVISGKAADESVKAEIMAHLGPDKNFLTSVIKIGEKKKLVEPAQIAQSVREDLLGAQQIINSLVPPEKLKEIHELEMQYKTADANDKDRIANELSAKRQTVYRAVLCANNVQPANLDGYDVEEGKIKYTDDEKALAEQIKERSTQVIEFTDPYDSQKKVTRRLDAFKVLDSNRIATIDMLYEYKDECNIPQDAIRKLRSYETWDRLQMERAAIKNDPIATQDDTKETFAKKIKDAREAADKEFDAIVHNTLGIDTNNPNYSKIRGVLIDRLNTDLRLRVVDQTDEEKRTRFAKLSGGTIPENLSLTEYRHMGLKGIELLLRRSMYQPQTPNELKDVKIKLMQFVEGPTVDRLEDKLGALDSFAPAAEEAIDNTKYELTKVEKKETKEIDFDKELKNIIDDLSGSILLGELDPLNNLSLAEIKEKFQVDGQSIPIENIRTFLQDHKLVDEGKTEITDSKTNKVIQIPENVSPQDYVRVARALDLCFFALHEKYPTLDFAKRIKTDEAKALFKAFKYIPQVLAGVQDPHNIQSRAGLALIKDVFDTSLNVKPEDIKIEIIKPPTPTPKLLETSATDPLLLTDESEHTQAEKETQKNIDAAEEAAAERRKARHDAARARLNQNIPSGPTINLGQESQLNWNKSRVRTEIPAPKTPESIELLYDKYLPNNITAEIRKPVAELGITMAKTILTQPDQYGRNNTNGILPDNFRNVILLATATEATNVLTSHQSENTVRDHQHLYQSLVRGIIAPTEINSSVTARVSQLNNRLDYLPPRFTTLLRNPSEGGVIPRTFEGSIQSMFTPRLQQEFETRVAENYLRIFGQPESVLTDNQKNNLTKTDLDFISRVTALQMIDEYGRYNQIQPRLTMPNTQQIVDEWAMRRSETVRKVQHLSTPTKPQVMEERLSNRKTELEQLDQDRKDAAGFKTMYSTITRNEPAQKQSLSYLSDIHEIATTETAVKNRIDHILDEVSHLNITREGDISLQDCRRLREITAEVTQQMEQLHHGEPKNGYRDYNPDQHDLNLQHVRQALIAHLQQTKNFDENHTQSSDVPPDDAYKPLAAEEVVTREAETTQILQNNNRVVVPVERPSQPKQVDDERSRLVQDLVHDIQRIKTTGIQQTIVPHVQQAQSKEQEFDRRREEQKALELKIAEDQRMIDGFKYIFHALDQDGVAAMGRKYFSDITTSLGVPTVNGDSRDAVTTLLAEVDQIEISDKGEISPANCHRLDNITRQIVTFLEGTHSNSDGNLVGYNPEKHTDNIKHVRQGLIYHLKENLNHKPTSEQATKEETIEKPRVERTGPVVIGQPEQQTVASVFQVQPQGTRKNPDEIENKPLTSTNKALENFKTKFTEFEATDRMSTDWQSIEMIERHGGTPKEVTQGIRELRQLVIGDDGSMNTADLRRFNNLVEGITYTLEENGWDRNSHDANIERVQNALILQLRNLKGVKKFETNQVKEMKQKEPTINRQAEMRQYETQRITELRDLYLQLQSNRDLLDQSYQLYLALEGLTRAEHLTHNHAEIQSLLARIDTLSVPENGEFTADQMYYINALVHDTLGPIGFVPTEVRAVFPNLPRGVESAIIARAIHNRTASLTPTPTTVTPTAAQAAETKVAVQTDLGRNTQEARSIETNPQPTGRKESILAVHSEFDEILSTLEAMLTSGKNADIQELAGYLSAKNKVGSPLDRSWRRFAISECLYELAEKQPSTILNALRSHHLFSSFADILGADISHMEGAFQANTVLSRGNIIDVMQSLIQRENTKQAMSRLLTQNPKLLDALNRFVNINYRQELFRDHGRGEDGSDNNQLLYEECIRAQQRAKLLLESVSISVQNAGSQNRSPNRQPKRK